MPTFFRARNFLTATAIDNGQPTAMIVATSKQSWGARMPLEKTIVAKVKRVAEAAGWWVTKLHGGPMQKAGLPDLLCLKDGSACFLEVKQPGKGKASDATPLQQQRMREILEKGGAPSFVVRGEDEARSALLLATHKVVVPRESCRTASLDGVVARGERRCVGSK